MTQRIDLPDLDVTADDILVLRNAGPKGGPGMPEAGYLPIPLKLARQGVKDMVRISDARMSGTAFGTIVLHITPEAAVGGPLAIVRTGDRITLDVEARRIELLVEDVEIEKRLAEWKLLPAVHQLAKRGYAKLFENSVLQADQGCDFDFLLREGGTGAALLTGPERYYNTIANEDLADEMLDPATANGVYAIAATPFTPEGAVDTKSVDRLTDFYPRLRGYRPYHSRDYGGGAEARARRGVGDLQPGGAPGKCAGDCRRVGAGFCGDARAGAWRDGCRGGGRDDRAAAATAHG